MAGFVPPRYQAPDYGRPLVPARHLAWLVVGGALMWAAGICTALWITGVVH